MIFDIEAIDLDPDQLKMMTIDVIKCSKVEADDSFRLAMQMYGQENPWEYSLYEAVRRCMITEPISQKALSYKYGAGFGKQNLGKFVVPEAYKL